MNAPNNRSSASPRPTSTSTTRRCCFRSRALPKRVELGLHGAAAVFRRRPVDRLRAELAQRRAASRRWRSRTSPCRARRRTSSRASRSSSTSTASTTRLFAVGRRGARPHPRRPERSGLARQRRSQSSVGVRADAARPCSTASRCTSSTASSLDRLDIECTHYTPAPELLSAAFDEQPVEEVLTSNLLKSNCLVTGQPDWGSVQIRYSGPADRPGRAAALHRELSQPQRIPRAVRRAHLHGHLARAASRPSWPCMRATPGAAGWTSTRSAPATRCRCRRTSGRRGSSLNSVRGKSPAAAGREMSRLAFPSWRQPLRGHARCSRSRPGSIPSA